MSKFDKKELDSFSDKDSKVDYYRELYEEKPFIEAYSEHTDLRIMKDGPELAIGAKRDGQQDWDVHARTQLQFLVRHGLAPEHRLLDLGCGTGRLASVAVPYMDHGCYTGIDISRKAIKCAIKYCGDYGLMPKEPTFVLTKGGLDIVKNHHFDFIWAHSIFTHIPMEVAEQIFTDLEGIEFKKFMFTFKERDSTQRTGLKQFSYSVADLTALAKRHGFHGEKLVDEWPAGQKTMRIWR